MPNRCHKLLEGRACKIDPSGLNKRGLINALRRNDNDNDNDDVEGIAENGVQNGRDGEVDDEIQFRVSAQRRGNGDVIVGSAVGSETEGDGDSASSVTVMQLKLELAREERERERERYEREREQHDREREQYEREKERDERARELLERQFQIEKERAELGLHASATGPGGSRPTVRGDLSHLLPRMHDNDPLVFFSAFERSLLLHGVDKQEWTKYLPSCLTLKANKVLSGLSLDENKDFDACKQNDCALVWSLYCVE